MKLFMEQINSYLLKEDLSKRINYYDKGKFYKEQCKYDEAIKWLKKGIEVNPNNIDCYLFLGSVYNKLFQYDEAIKWFKKGIEVAPNNVNGYERLGSSYNSQYQYDEAIKWFKKSIEIDPNCDACYDGMAFSYMFRRDYEKALFYIKKAIKLNPNTIKYYFKLYLNNAKLGKEDGVTDFLNALAKDNLVPEGIMDMLKKISNKEDIPEEIMRWVLFDTNEIIKICKENKIKILLLDYPQRQMLFDNIAKANAVPFMSNYRMFCKLKESGERMESYFTLNNTHCNDKGYTVMARNLFERIRKEKIFDLD